MKKKKYLILSVVLVVLIMGAAIGSTMAYFTTYTHAVGGQPIKLGHSTRFKEDFSSKTKHVVVTNEEGSAAVFVRAKAFSGSDYPLQYVGEGWSTELPAGSISDGKEGYYYYSAPLQGTAGLTEDERSTKPLDVSITFPEEAEEEDSFSVVVIYESTLAKYDENGNAYADWSEILDVKQSAIEGPNAFLAEIDWKGGLEA